MQEPVGYELVDGRAQMNDFFAIVTNPNIFVQYPHVLASGLTTAAFFVMGISAFHLLRQHKDTEFFKRSFSMGMVFGFMGVFLVIVGGHDQAQHMVESQPMKMAAAEALWDSEDPASFSVFTVGDEKDREDVFAVRLPAMLSVLAYNSSEAEVQGINDLQKQYEEQYGEGDYVPPVAITYWSFRIMVGAGFLMLAITILGLFFMFENSFARRKRFLQFMLIAMAFPYIANTAGWTMTEVGRQPWIVFGLQRTEDAISPNVDAAAILFSLIVYTTIYGMLMGADIYLLNKYARRGPDAPDETAQAEETSTAKPVSGLKPQVAPGD
jgi:cytochrome d ubiquinol oxidase subunit I